MDQQGEIKEIMDQPADTHSLLAVAIGNSRIKFGRFEQSSECRDRALGGELPIAGPTLPEPAETFQLSLSAPDGRFDSRSLETWLDSIPHAAKWRIASVNRPVTERLAEFAASGECRARPAPHIRQLTWRDVPIEIDLPQPERVGIDRLLAADAANRLRPPGRPAVVVDFGTAITVNLVRPDGAFAGGAILPGTGLGAWALAERTDALPQIDVEALTEPPAAVGNATVAAIESGLFWGAIGAVRELAARMAAGNEAPLRVYLTGGAEPVIAAMLADDTAWDVRHVPHLVLAGIALAGETSL